MKSFSSLLLLLAVTGCGGGRVWYQPGVSADQTRRDLGACRMQAAYAPVETRQSMNGIGIFLSTEIAQDNYLNACMASKGYQAVPAKAVANSAYFPPAK